MNNRSNMQLSLVDCLSPHNSYWSIFKLIYFLIEYAICYSLFVLYKVCFYDIYLSNISKNKISKFSNDRIWTYEVVTLNLEFNWFDRSQTLLFAFSIFVVETVTIFGDIL